MEITEIQQQKINATGKKYDLRLAVLHGSFADGKAREGSDIDIAVLGHHPISLKSLLKMHGAFAEVFGESSKREIDLKSLHRADPLFLYHVLKKSRLIYGNLTDYNELRAYAFVNYFDSKDLFRLENVLVRKFQNYLNKKYA